MGCVVAAWKGEHARVSQLTFIQQNCELSNREAAVATLAFGARSLQFLGWLNANRQPTNQPGPVTAGRSGEFRDKGKAGDQSPVLGSQFARQNALSAKCRFSCKTHPFDRSKQLTRRYKILLDVV